jgi:hypothetical protein
VGVVQLIVVNDMQVAIEAKASSKVTTDHLRGLRALIQDHPRVKRRILLCLEPKSRRTEDGILVLPAADFCQRLHAGDLF